MCNNGSKQGAQPSASPYAPALLISDTSLFSLEASSHPDPSCPTHASQASAVKVIRRPFPCRAIVLIPDTTKQFSVSPLYTSHSLLSPCAIHKSCLSPFVVDAICPNIPTVRFKARNPRFHLEQSFAAARINLPNQHTFPHFHLFVGTA